MFNLEIFNSNVSRLNVSFDIFVRLQITAGETHNSMLAFWYAWTFTHRPNCTESELQLMCTIVRVHNCDTMKVHNCEKMKVHNCEQLKLHNLLGKCAQLWTTESAKLCKSNLANGTEDTPRIGKGEDMACHRTLWWGFQPIVFKFRALWFIWHK